MEESKHIFFISVGIFALMALIFNLFVKNFPKIPGDIYIDKPGIRVYIPFTSIIVLTILYTLFSDDLKRLIGLG